MNYAESRRAKLTSSVCHVPVLDVGHLLRVHHRVELRLQTDLAHLHRRHHHNSLRCASAQTRDKDALVIADSVLIGKLLLIKLERREADSHLRHDTRNHSSQALVERKWSLAANDVETSSKETSRAPTLATELHSCFDCVQGVANRGFAEASEAASDQMLDEVLPRLFLLPIRFGKS